MHSVALNQLTLLNENLYNRKFKKLDKPNLNSQKKALYSRMMLSYFNIGVQQEHLKRHTDCEVSYNRSRNLASLIGDKEIVKRLSKSVNNVNSKHSHSNSHVQNLSNNSKNNHNNSNNFVNNSLYSTEVSEIKYFIYFLIQILVLKRA